MHRADFSFPLLSGSSSSLRVKFYEAAARASSSVAKYSERNQDFEAAALWKRRERLFLEKAKLRPDSFSN
jgi:hypothetical protein